jgi:hypothetical protein
MFTAAECRANAQKKLAQAKHDNRHSRRLINAAEAWLFLACRLSGEEPKRRLDQLNPAHPAPRRVPCITK